LRQILNEPVEGNGLVSLAHQLIAARLNQLNGASVPPDVVTAMEDADALIGSLRIPPICGGFWPCGWLDPADTDEVKTILDRYNNGCDPPGGPPHCGGPGDCSEERAAMAQSVEAQVNLAPVFEIEAQAPKVSVSQAPATDPQPPAVVADTSTDEEAQPAAEAPQGPDGLLASAMDALQNVITSLVTFVQGLF
jgi:hypothetical protein